MIGIIELYEDRRSGWRVLTSRGGAIGYRFIIVDRAGRSTFAADATELASGKVPAGLEQVALEADSSHGMILMEPCALWRRGRVRRTRTKPGVLTAAYISGEVTVAVGIGHHQSLGAMVPVVHRQGDQHMPGTTSNGTTTRRRRPTHAAGARLVVTQITELVATNEQLQRAHRELTEENERLRGELTAIGSALDNLTGARRGRSRSRSAALALPEARPRQKRGPITDPEVLARRNAALARARAARADKLAAARAGSSGK